MIRAFASNDTLLESEVSLAVVVNNVLAHGVGEHAEPRLNQGVSGASIPHLQTFDEVKIKVRLPCR